ncbi:MAG: hypothetical protein ACC662_11295, partial [Planctomycetota bacterium]
MRIRVWGVFGGLVCGVLAAACGGSGGGAKTLTGVFVDAPVEGLVYRTPTHQGLTDAGGTFRYEPGEVVRFFLGDVLLGQAPGMPTVTPFDFAPDLEPVTGNAVLSGLLSKSNSPYHIVVNS